MAWWLFISYVGSCVCGRGGRSLWEAEIKEGGRGR